MLVIETRERLAYWQCPRLYWIALHFQEEREFECVGFVAVAGFVAVVVAAAVDLADLPVAAAAGQLINLRFCRQEKKSLQSL